MSWHRSQSLAQRIWVYFGYPAAHEDDAVRAVRSGLEIVAAVSQLEFTLPLHVRIGLHTGPVVVGEIGAGERTERLALGETPNIAARVQGVAEPDTVVMSTTTHHLVQGLFECHDLGPQTLKGLSTPLSLYRVIKESAAQSRFEVAVQAGLTPLMGRDVELSLLQERWVQAQDGEGQVVLLSGEAGIGKSRLIQELKDRVAQDGGVRIEFRCSSYHHSSAFYPLIEHLRRLLQIAHVLVGQFPDTVETQPELVAHHYTEAGLDVSPCLVLLAKGYAEVGQPQEGMNVVAEALARVNHGGEHYYEAELYRLKGEFVLQSGVTRRKSKACPERSRRVKRQRAKVKSSKS